MPVTVEVRTLQRTVDELRGAVDSLQGKYGNVLAVRRLRLDVERLELDVGELSSLPAAPATTASQQVHQLTDEPYDASMWADDADDEGLGGYHGTSR